MNDPLKCVCLGLMSLLYSSTVVAAEDSPFSFGALYTGEVWNNARGGTEKGTRYLHNIDLIMEADLSFAGLENTTLFVYGLHTNSPEFSPDLVGDAQVISNIDSGEVFRLQEAWIEKTFADEKVSVKAGLIDLNADFDVNEIGSLFINSSHGIAPEFSQTGANGPSIFPSSSLAARAQYALTENLSFRFGAFDAVPNDPDRPRHQRIAWGKGTLFVGEVSYLAKNGWRINAGGWGYTSEFQPILSTDKVGNNTGAYGLVEGPIYRAPGEDGRGLNGFVRVGFANERINQFSHYLGAGVVYTGLCNSRKQDQIGLAVAAAGNGDDFKRSVRMASGEAKNYETNIEFTYRAPLTDWLTLQPDIQYVINPGAADGLRNALAFGLRVEIGATF